MDGWRIGMAAGEAEVAACLALRWAVFVEEQGVPEPDEIDGEDEACAHVLGRIDGAPAAAARLKRLGPKMKIQRVCVARDLRGRGLGAAVIRFCVAQARAEGAAEAVLGAQTHALGFYEGLGFAPFGPVYDDAGIPHRDMRRALAAG
ncbi:MAG: GNAT family N-acetyltransferase [Pseudomonadota bacterium]